MQRDGSRVANDSVCQKLACDIQDCLSKNQYNESKCKGIGRDQIRSDQMSWGVDANRWLTRVSFLLETIDEWEHCVNTSKSIKDKPTTAATTPIAPTTITYPRTPTVWQGDDWPIDFDE